jgi:predicted dehydrogenase
MDARLKVGVIGCGQIAQIAHLPYLQELPMFEIGAVCDVSPTVADAVGERFGVRRRYQQFSELVKQQDLDAVLVTNKNHAGPAIAAMEAGKHTLVEKPIALNMAQADEMIAAARRNRVKLMVGYMKLYDPAFQLAQEYVAGMGKIHLIRVHDFAGSYKINSEIYDLVVATDEERGNLAEISAQDQRDMLGDLGSNRTDLLDAHDIMIHLCIHDINALHGLRGLPDGIVGARLYDGTIVTALLEYADGVRCMWETGNLVGLVEWDEHIKVWGADRRVEIRFPFPYLKNAATEVIVERNEGSSAVRERILASYDEAFKREWRHFYDCVRHDREPRTNGEMAREDLAFAVNLMKAATA